MKRKTVCAGNWKLNKTPDEAESYFKEFLPQLEKSHESHLVFFPQTYSLDRVSQLLKNTSIGFGPQNVYFEGSGAFTGENSSSLAKSLGSTHVLLGHSERRQYFAETDEDLNKKIDQVLADELSPMLCIGETQEERQSGATNEVLRSQLMGALLGVSAEQATRSLVIAYEPVWAIGTGEVATPEMAQETHQFVREVLKQLFGTETSTQMSILYGGSVKPDNASHLIEKPDIDGFLVGGASLKPQDFLSILRTVVRN